MLDLAGIVKEPKKSGMAVGLTRRNELRVADRGWIMLPVVHTAPTLLRAITVLVPVTTSSQVPASLWQ